MKKLVLFAILLLAFQRGIAQDDANVDIVSHEVQLGETVRLISKKYLVNPAEIYKLNKFATDGIRPGMVLRIPVPHKEPAVADAPATDSVETTVPDREQPTQPVAEAPVRKRTSKPAVKESVAEDNQQPVPVQPADVPSTDGATEHTVQQGETLYSLSRQFHVTVAQLKQANPDVDKGLKIGQVIRIPGSNNDAGSAQVAEMRSEKTPTTTVSPAGVSTDTAISYEVKSGETLFGLSRKFNIPVDELKAQNPEIEKHGLQVGQKLVIRRPN